MNLPHRVEGISLGGDVVFSAYKRKEDRSGYVLRMYNPSSESVSVAVSGISSVRESTLAEVHVGEVQPVTGVHVREVPAKRIATLEVG